LLRLFAQTALQIKRYVQNRVIYYHSF
jgi:hypothetical protein